MLLMKDREILKLRKSFEKAIVEITIEKLNHAKCENEIKELKKELRRAKTSLGFTEARLKDKRLANVELPVSLLTIERQRITEQEYLDELRANEWMMITYCEEETNPYKNYEAEHEFIGDEIPF